MRVPPRVAASLRPIGARACVLAAALTALAAAPTDAGPHVRVQVERFGLKRVESIPLERYVAGVVAAEVPGSWPAAALRAQAVASRTYALHRMAEARRSDAAYDVEAATTGQVFTRETVSAPVQAAVGATAGEVLLFAGRPLLAAFHSTSGGRTASAEEVWGEPHPYLRSIPVPDEEDAPATYWRTPVSRHTMRRALEAYGLQVGRIQDVRITERSESGRVLRVRVRGDAGTAVLSGRELRSALGETRVKSTLFALRTRSRGANNPTAGSGSGRPDRAPDAGADASERAPGLPPVGAGPTTTATEGDFVIVGSGYGHGVGLSQWAARAMAADGRDHPEILSIFYRGARLARLGPAELAALARGERSAASPSNERPSGEQP